MPAEAPARRQSLHDVIRAIYGAALEPARWPETLQAIAELLGDVGAILIYGRDDGTFGVVCSPSLDQCVAEYAVGWSSRDVRANRARERGLFFSRDVITDRHILTPEELESDPFYSVFLPQHGLRYFAAAMVSPDPRIEVALSIQRAADRPVYTDEELALVREIGAHAEMALRISIRLMDAELIKTGLGAALARLGLGVFALAADGRVIFSNPAAISLLGDGITIANGRLRIESPVSIRVDAEIEKLISDQYDFTTAPTPFMVERRNSARPLAIYLMPIPVGAGTGADFLGQARAIVLVVGSDTDTPPDPAVVRDLLGLTLGEARIASLIGTGIPPQEAADQLGVSVETARTVLKRVFQKVGVSRQSELAVLMTKLMIR